MELVAEKREKLGKANKSLRNEGKVPGVIFGKNMESIPVTFSYDAFKKIWDKSGETDLIDIKLGSHIYKILIKNVQYDPVSGKISHVELYKPDLTVKVEVQIPVEVIGEDNNEFVKAGEAMVFYVVDEVTVKALPTDLPHNFTVDVTNMVIGEGVTVAQLNYDKEKVEIVDLEMDGFVIRLDKMEEQKEEEEVAPVSEEEAIAGVEAVAEKKPEEGEEGEESEEDKGKEGKEPIKSKESTKGEEKAKKKEEKK
jgi:large subunit ribosomal protein L25